MAFNKVRYSARQYALEDIVGEPEEQEELSEEETMPTYEEEEGNVSPVEVYEDAQDEVVEQTEAMEALYATVQEFQAEGGMSPQTAVMVQMCMENILGVYAENVNMPALESFAEVGGRATATAYALEGIWENIKKWFQKMIASVVAWATKIKNWIVERVNRANRIKVQAVSLKKKMGEVKGYSHKASTMDVSVALYNLLASNPEKNPIEALKHIKAGLDSTEKTDAELTALAESFKRNLEYYSKYAEKENIEKETKRLETTDAVANRLTGTSTFMQWKESGQQTNGHAYKSCLFMGPAALRLYVRGDSDGKFITASIIKGPAENVTDVKTGNYKSPMLAPEAIIELLNEIIIVCDAITRNKIDGGKYDRYVSDLKKLGDAALAKLKESENDNKEAVAIIKQKIYAIPTMSKILNSGRRAMMSIALSAVVGSWEYAVKSASYIKKKKE